MANTIIGSIAARGAKVLIIGVGGATSSGKTTLAKQLVSILRDQQQPASQMQAQKRPLDTVILHQDDFALPEEQLPFGKCGSEDVRDWDHPEGTIDYRRMEAALRHAREYGSLPPHHSSHDHLNEQPEKPLFSPEKTTLWHKRLKSAMSKENIGSIVIADGFLLYYDEGVRRQMDIRLFLRSTRATLERRRQHRGGYATAEGTVWQDPPTYFADIVWPAYHLAHKRLFIEGDVEHGELVKTETDLPGDGQPVRGLVLLDSNDSKEEGDTSMDTIVEAACQAIEDHIMQR